MKQLYIVLLLLLYCTLAFAEKDFRKGYVVQGTDTLGGYVHYRGDKRNSQSATFKFNPEGSEQVFTPDDIAGYGFEKENKAFESKTIISDAQADSAPQKLFMNVLVKGRTSIYSYRDSHSLDHYYLQKDTLFKELVQHKHEQTDPRTGKIHLVTSSMYRGVLNMAFTDCASFSASQLEQVKLLHRDLINITVKYNQCVAPAEAAVSYKHREKKAVITVGPVLVYTQARLQFSSNSFYS